MIEPMPDVPPVHRMQPGARLGRMLLVLILSSACGACYLLQAAAGQAELSARRRPIAAVIGDPATAESVRTQLARVVELRDFASAQLGLPDNASYRTYADVGRRYVVWNVFAAPEFSVEPLTWCFPVAGCVAYRGYFHEADARDYALGLRSRGFDVLVGGVPAYSTLGHFADPVLNTMLGWSEADLAALLFHELAHQVAYAPGDTNFNEAFATVVEREGVRRWFAFRGDAAALATYEAHAARHVATAQVLADARQRLAALYGSGLAPVAMREAKREELDRVRDLFASAAAEGRVDPGYASLFGPQFGNASLLAVSAYEDCVPSLSAELVAAQGDLAAFYARVRVLAHLPREERHRILAGRAPEACR